MVEEFYLHGQPLEIRFMIKSYIGSKCPLGDDMLFVNLLYVSLGDEIILFSMCSQTSL